MVQSLGIKYRMGAIWKPNKGFSAKLLMNMFLKLRKIYICNEWVEKHKWSTFAAYSVSIYVLSLCDTEGFLLNLEEIRKNRSRNTTIFLVGLKRKIEG